MSPIKQAATLRDGIIWTGRRHCSIIHEMIDNGCKPPITQKEQGFVDEDGKFLNREEAYHRAVACGQIKDDGGTPRLLSEMLY